MLEAFSKFLPKLRKPKPHRPIITTSESGVDGTFTCRVVLLDGSAMFLDVKLSEKGQVVMNQVYSKLRLYEKEFFSLKFLENGTQKWLKLSKSINSQLTGSGPHTLFFCVRFYPMGPARIMSDIGRYQIYLQIRKDIQQGKLPLPDDVCPTFAALALQADAGEVDVMNLDQEDLIVISVFKPHQKTMEEFKASVRQEQKKYEGKSSSRAEFSFLEQASWLDHYGVEMHEVKGEDGSSFELGISPTGLLLFREGKRVGAHYWPRLSKISFRNKLLQLRIIVTTGGEETRSYECSDKESCKSLYKSCIAHHAFFKLVTSTSIHQSLPQNSMKHSSSSSKLFSIGSKMRRDPTVIPDVVSGEAYHQPHQYYHHHHQRRSRRNSGSESCPENDRFMSRPSSCAMIPNGRRVDYPESPMGQRSFYYAEGSARRMSPVSMYGGSRRGFCSRDDDYISGSESESMALGQDRRFHRGHPVYMTTVEARRGRSRPLEDASFYSEVEREPRRHHRHCRSRHRVYPDDPRQGFRERYVGPQYGMDFHHVYDRLPADFESVGYPVERETTIRWADDNGRRDYERSKHSRSEIQSDARKRYRKRSQSPGCGTRPPQELASHFRYVDQLDAGVSDEKLREIPYTRVETDIAAVPGKYSPRTKSRIRMSRRTTTQRRQNSEIMGHSMVIPDGEAPPPYLGAANSPGRRSEASDFTRSRRAAGILEGMESRDSAPASRSRMQNGNIVDNYRRDANSLLERGSNQEQSSVTDYHDVDGPESQEEMDSRSRSHQQAYIDTVENYRREMSSRLARSSDPNEATLGWYDHSNHEVGDFGRVDSRIRNL